jgi:hypothetical protein
MAPVSSLFFTTTAPGPPTRAQRWRAAGRLALASLLLLLPLLAVPACTTGRPVLPVPVTASYRDDGVLLSAGHRPILFYRSRPPAAAEPWRVHYLHPVHAPDGRLLSEDAPADHVHQRGVYWAWRRILLHDVPVADGWVGRDLNLQVSVPRFEALADGVGRLHTRAVWRVRQAPLALDLIEENTTFDVSVLEPGEFRIEIEIHLRALQSGVALAGTDDEKGYGGFSFRLPEPERLEFSSNGATLQARVAAVETGTTVEFGWADGARSSGLRVDMACTVDGQPWRQWVLRREPSMQNCAFPGRRPVVVPVDRPLRLHVSLRLRAPVASAAAPVR